VFTFYIIVTCECSLYSIILFERLSLSFHVS